jgi:TPR repeat protein
MTTICAAASVTARVTPSYKDARRQIEARDCDYAVSRLAGWLKQGESKVFLLAATMYENGLCVKRDWSNAVNFYTAAFEKGLPEAADRRAAGYADPVNGPAIAAALRWAHKGRGLDARVCAVSKDVRDDPEGFVA